MDTTINTIVATMSDGSTVTLFPIASPAPTPTPSVPTFAIPLNTPVEITSA